MTPKLQIVVSVSDPWEFHEDNENSNIFYAELTDYQCDCIFFSSHKSITLRSKTGKKQWRNFLGIPRHAVKNIIDKIASHDGYCGGCFCNIYAVADDTITISDAKQQYRAWRGGNAFIGTIELSDNHELQRNLQTLQAIRANLIKMQENIPRNRVQVEKEADIAWLQKNFREVVDLYGLFLSDLTLLQKKKYDYSLKKLNER